MRVLGLGGSHHDYGACLVRDGVVVSAVEEERLTRVKMAFGLGPRLAKAEAVDYVLGEAGLGVDDVDLVVANDFLNPVYAARFGDRVHWIGHHLSHAASTFYTSPFEEAAVLVLDGRGSDVGTDAGLCCETTTSYRAGPSGLRPLTAHAGRVTLADERSVDPCEDSIGWMYELVSREIGFGGPGGQGAGKTMGLAAYGGPRYVDAMRECYSLADGRFRQSTQQQIAMRRHIQSELAKAGERGRDEVRADLAHAVQHHVERVIVELARWLHKQTGQPRLCLAGGVALNSVANFKILEETPFEEVHIVPAAGDSGTSLGAALYGHHEHGGAGWTPRPEPFSPYLGREYGTADIDAALNAVSDRVRVSRPAELLVTVALRLAAGDVVGWFQGRSEIGPRALGNRSILADPRPAWMKDRINEKVKHREPFRPFAPIVRQARQAEFFGTDVPVHYMLLVAPVLEHKRQQIAAVTHADGSARLQTVTAALNPRLDALLAAFERLTGVPVLLNTSFNDNDEPIVESPADAVRCFLNTDLDALVLGDTLVTKVPAP
ncbi:carbamoyltransferase family protein [Dactylosporangium sp. CA-052675]|uniref:carbamoyltransferase family protein n=1 Tax=Dactylosporangium sp. CA-052675 TaxID=3239927 RepID=UPI003D8FCDB7